MKKNSLLLTLLLSASSLLAQGLDNYKPGITDEGMVYNLPKTGLKITIDVERKKYTPGEFVDYAELYLSSKGVSQTENEKYRLLNLKLEAFGTPDTTKCYAVRFNKDKTNTNALLTDDGILLAINSDEAKPATAGNNFKRGMVKPYSEDHKHLNPHDFMSQDILSAGSIGKMAQLTAEEIYEIRDSKNQLNRGQADFMPQDGAQLRLMLQNLNEQEAALTQTFLGETVCDTATYVITYIPEKEVTNDVLLRFSENLGLLDKTDIAGAPYYITIKDLHTIPAEEEPTGKVKKKPENGLWINIASRASIVIAASPEIGTGNALTKQQLNAEMPLAQFGRTEILSDELFSKKFITLVELSPLTGSVIKMQSK